MNRGSSKSLLPLVEILISIGIFSIAVVLTLQLFLLARFLGEKTSDTARAIFEVQNIAETIKTIKTDAEMENYITEELNGSITGAGEQNMYYTLFYDFEWNRAGSEAEAEYTMKIDMSRDTYNTGGLYKFKLSMYRIEAYPFIDDVKVENDENYTPLLISVDASKFIKK
jgi:hypothetical protein